MKKLTDRAVGLYRTGLGFYAAHREGLSYLVFGGLTTLVNWVVSFILKRVGVSTEVNTAAAWFVSVLFAYVTNRRFVFQAKRTGFLGFLREIGGFYAARSISGVMDVGIMKLGADYLGLWFWGVKLFSQVFVIVFNYFASKFFIFKKDNKGS